MSSEPLFLGLDASTQSLKASLLSSNLDVLRECAISFDADLPSYKTKGGVLFGKDGEVFSPVQMIVEAVDVLIDKIKAAKWELNRVKGVSAAGQVNRREDRAGASARSGPSLPVCGRR